MLNWRGTMTSDLAKRLRNLADLCFGVGDAESAPIWEAATEIERLTADNAALTARVAELEVALKPFAEITPSSLYPSDGSEGEPYGVYLAVGCPQTDWDFSGRDLARARAALTRTAKGEPT